LGKITFYHIFVIISVLVVTYSWFSSDGSHFFWNVPAFHHS